MPDLTIQNVIDDINQLYGKMYVISRMGEDLDLEEKASMIKFREFVGNISLDLTLMISQKNTPNRVKAAANSVRRIIRREDEILNMIEAESQLDLLEEELKRAEKMMNSRVFLSAFYKLMFIVECDLFEG